MYSLKSKLNGVVYMEKKVTRTELKREAILQAATKVFMAQGFKATSVDVVAQEAGVSKKTLYHHFGNKEGLFRTMLEAHWMALFQRQTVLFAESLSVKDNLLQFADAFFTFLYDPNTVNLFRILIAESRHFPDLADTILIGNKAPFTRALIAFLEEQTHKGTLRCDNAHRAAAFFMGLLKEDHFWPMMLGFVAVQEPFDTKALAQEAIDLFLHFYVSDKKP